jgi:hypothetical protein
MTITIGPDSFKSKFIKDEKEGWKHTLNRGDAEEASPARSKPAAPSQPASKGSDGKSTTGG